MKTVIGTVTRIGIGPQIVNETVTGIEQEIGTWPEIGIGIAVSNRTVAGIVVGTGVGNDAGLEIGSGSERRIGIGTLIWIWIGIAAGTGIGVVSVAGHTLCHRTPPVPLPLEVPPLAVPSLIHEPISGPESPE